MKKIGIIIVVLLLSQLKQLNAQERIERNNQVQTLFGNGGGFGGFLEVEAKAGEINGQSGLLVGGAIKGVFSSKFNIGFAGYGLTTKVEADTYDDENKLYQIDFGYGGLVIEPVIGNRHAVHVTLPILFGVGGIGLKKRRYEPFEDDPIDLKKYEAFDDDVFVVLEPGLNLEINLLRNLRLNLGTTYRYIYDKDVIGLSDEELSGFTGKVGLKLGWF